MKNIGSYVKAANLKNIKVEYLREEKERVVEKCDAQIKVLRKQTGPSYVIGRIAKALKKKFGYAKAEVLGPFGLGCHTSIHLYRKKEDTIHDVLSITFELDYGDKPTINVLNYNERKGEYPVDSIGALNGFDHPLVDVSTTTLDELHDLILKMNKEKVKRKTAKAQRA